ncbi:MAG: hypothetical protein WDN04_27335 [Rhodospirillales bacterium]
MTDPNFAGPAPGQATPFGIAAVAAQFVGQAWNNQGCWVLASTIAAEAGAGLPVQSTAVGVAGRANGEWAVIYNGPRGRERRLAEHGKYRRHCLFRYRGRRRPHHDLRFRQRQLGDAGGQHHLSEPARADHQSRQ